MITSITSSVTIIFTEEEAHRLKNLAQNPSGLNETREDSLFREKLFKAITRIFALEEY